MKKAAKWLWRVATEFVGNDLHNHAAEMAYFAMMSVFPFFLLLTALLTFVPIPMVFGEAMTALRELAPAGVVDVLESTVRDVSAQLKMNLVSITAVACIWMSIGAMGSTTRGLNKAFGLKDPRHYVRFFGLSLLMALVIGIILILAIATVMASPLIHDAVVSRVNLGAFGNILFIVLRYALTLFFLLLTHAGLYWLCPAVKRSFRLFTPGAVFSVTSWVLVSYGLRVYLSHFNSYDRIYGSLGAVILMLFWFYLMSMLLLLGAQIDAVLHPEYKMPEASAEQIAPRPRPARTLLIALGIFAVAMAALLFLRPESFVPTAAPLGGDVGAAVSRSLESGKEKLDHSDLEEILSMCRFRDGTLDVTQILAINEPAIERYLSRFETTELGELQPEELHALLLNISTAAGLKIILSRTLTAPIPEPLTPTDKSRRFIQLQGELLSLNDIEHRLLRPFFKDPRDLFCVEALSQTPLAFAPFAFNGDDLSGQLSLVAFGGLRSPWVFIEGETVILPAFIQRYASDFDSYSGGLKGFLIRFMRGERQSLISQNGLSAISYR